MRKSQLQLIDSGLFLYGSLVTFFLVISAFFNLSGPGNIIILILFLPVAFYFAIKIFNSSKRLFLKLMNLDQQKHPYFGNFSLSTFINQSEPTFLVNIVLLFFAIALILFRISLQLLK